MPVFHGVVETDAEPGKRLDRYAIDKVSGITRSQLKLRLARSLVNGKAVKLSAKIFPGDAVELEWNDPPPSELEPEDIPLNVLYEDERVLVVDKPQGLVVHPGAGNARGTLANAILFRLRARRDTVRSLSATSRPGIVHRLDKDTSGVMIAAYDEEALAFLAAQFKERSTRKTYVAIVVGNPKSDDGIVSTMMGRDPRDRKRFAVSSGSGKLAVTQFRVLERFDSFALLLLRPKTGRTHQLRVHLRHLGTPILGDRIYGGAHPRFSAATLMLHAYRLTLRVPNGEHRSTFTAPLPARFREMLRVLRAQRDRPVRRS